MNLWNKNQDKVYYISAFFGLVAGNMFNYSIVIFSHSLADNESFASQVFFLAYLPFLFFSFRAGYYLDKFPRKWVIALSQLLTFSSSFIPGLLAYNGLLDSGNKEILYIFALTNGLGLSFTMPGRFAILGDIVPQDKITKATVFLNVMILLGFAIAPIIAGNIRESYSYGTLLMTTGLIYLTSTMILLTVYIPFEKKHNHPHRKQAFQESLEFIKDKRIVREALVAMFLGMMIVGPVQVLVPEFGKKVLDLSESQRGIMMGLLGIGLLSGSIGSTWLSSRSGRGAFVMLAILASGVFVAMVGINQEFGFVVSYLYFGGLFLGALTSFLPSIIQESTPNQLRGRVMSFFSLIFLLTPAVSGLIYGGLTHFFSLTMTISIAGGVTVLLGIIGLMALKDLRTYR
jgi:MFS family permease